MPDLLIEGAPVEYFKPLEAETGQGAFGVLGLALRRREGA